MYLYGDFPRWVKSNYCLKVAVAGVPSTVVLNQLYTYTITVKNTGTARQKKVWIIYDNGYTVTDSSLKPFKRRPRPDATVDWYEIIWQSFNLKPGATKRFTVTVVYKDPHPSGDGAGVEVKAGAAGKETWAMVNKTVRY